MPCSWWAVAALAATGRTEEARERADALCEALPRLLPEEVHPGTAEPLGNIPLVWSHMEMARALWMLEVKVIENRWGVVGAHVWVTLKVLRRRLRLRHKRSGRP